MSQNVIIIAEAGVNHNGSMDVAKELIIEAANAGADYVKFQSFVTERNIARKAPKADYQVETTGAKESQFDMVKKLELDIEAHHQIQSWCKDFNIGFLSTPFDKQSADLLFDLGIPMLKIASGEITNLPLLRYFAQKFSSSRVPVLLSTGMSTMVEVDEAINVLENGGIDPSLITILHCTTEYPAPFSDLNLNALQTIKDHTKKDIGYSDHSLGIEVPIAAVALGARVIEKHFTLDKSSHGPDHRASLEPSEMRAMVVSIRNIENALGTKEKRPSPCEQKNLAIARKSIVASESIKKGEVLHEGNLEVKRPGTGISPIHWDKVVGTVANRDYQEDDFIE